MKGGHRGKINFSRILWIISNISIIIADIFLLDLIVNGGGKAIGVFCFVFYSLSIFIQRLSGRSTVTKNVFEIDSEGNQS